MNPNSLRRLPFFRNASFCWVVSTPNTMLSVRSQGNTNCCYAFVIVDAMYAKQMLDHGMAMKGSEQELLDLLHLIYPHWSAKYDEYGRIIVDERGLPNSYLNAYMYIQNFGLSLGIHYPFLGICIPRAWPAHLPRGPRSKLFIPSYYDVPNTNVRRALHFSPLAAGIVNFPSFRRWFSQSSIYMRPNNAEVYALRRGVDFGGHAILVVYVIKNSWGENWGYNGYAKISAALLDGCYIYMSCPHTPRLLLPA